MGKLWTFLLGKNKGELDALFLEYVAKENKTKNDYLELAEICTLLADCE